MAAAAGGAQHDAIASGGHVLLPGQEIPVQVLLGVAPGQDQNLGVTVALHQFSTQGRNMLLHRFAQRRCVEGIGAAVCLCAEVAHGEAQLLRAQVAVGSRQCHHTQFIRAAEQRGVFAEAVGQIGDLVGLDGSVGDRIVHSDEVIAEVFGLFQQPVCQPELSGPCVQIGTYLLLRQLRHNLRTVFAVGITGDDILYRQRLTAQLLPCSSTVLAKQAVLRPVQAAVARGGGQTHHGVKDIDRFALRQLRQIVDGGIFPLQIRVVEPSAADQAAGEKLVQADDQHVALRLILLEPGKQALPVAAGQAIGIGFLSVQPRGIERFLRHQDLPADALGLINRPQVIDRTVVQGKIAYGQHRHAGKGVAEAAQDRGKLRTCRIAAGLEHLPLPFLHAAEQPCRHGPLHGITRPALDLRGVGKALQSLPWADVIAAASRITVQQRRRLLPADRLVRTEGAVLKALGDLVFRAPCHCLGIPCLGVNVREKGTIRLRLSCHAVEHGQEHGAGGVLLRQEYLRPHAVKQAPARRLHNALIKPVLGRYIGVAHLFSVFRFAGLLRC